MAKKNIEADVEAQPKGRPDIASISRTSDVAQADYINTLVQFAPEELEGLVDEAVVNEVTAAIEAAGELFASTTEAAIERAIKTKVEAAVKALSNDDPLNGYATRVFDPEVFAKKVQPKVKRERLSPEKKVEKIVESASPEMLEALKRLLESKGLAEDTVEV